MKRITSLAEAEAVLATYVPVVSSITGKLLTLERSQKLMAALGNPEKKLNVIHVAGTSGKTSTSYYIAALLTASDNRVGLTVSPHIDSVTERIQINGQPISEELFCRYLLECLELIEDIDIQPSYFELLMALAYYVFYKENVDFAVIETGLGGLLDASNVAQAPNKVCVITDIGYDHMHVLGNTLYDIATQKAGIIHAHNNVFMYKQSHNVMKAIRERIEATQAQLYVVPEQNTLLHSGLPLFQQRNLGLAMAVSEHVLKKPVSNGLAVADSVVVPARMQTINYGSKTLIMDGAHNGQKMQSFVASYSAAYKQQKATIVLAVKNGKEYTDVIQALLPIADNFICTTFATTQDLPSVAMSPNDLQSYLQKNGAVAAVIPDAKQALQTATQKMPEIVIVTGSFYLLSQLRQAI